MRLFARTSLVILAAALILPSCGTPTASPTLPGSGLLLSLPDTVTPMPTETPAATSTPRPRVPNFDHIGIIVFEDRDFESVVGSPAMPYLNLLAGTFTLLTGHHAVAHPSLPNYLALAGGDTFGITTDCDPAECPVDAPSLPDLIEASGRTWKTYQDDMPGPCTKQDTWRYLQRHNPFLYFQSIGGNEKRCYETVVPFTQLEEDLAAGSLPNFFFIAPDICYSGRDCALELVDGWLKDLVERLHPALSADGRTFLLIVTWDEGRGSESCCGLPEQAGGRVATVLVSPQVKSAFQDPTPYTHYSILKTISEAWGLPYLGRAADPQTALITSPWK